jgi:two-component system alkaline phosphatase synthesis response regulator PhoP
LKHEGHEVSTASKGGEALRFVASQRPDAVVTEVCLPGMDGLDLMARVLEHERSIIVILNCRSASHMRSFMSWAADPYVVKSSGNRELCETLAQLLSRRARAAGATNREAASVAERECPALTA